MKRLDVDAALNREQRDAVTHGEGPQLVLAGAGSGKTRVITWRMAWLAQDQGVAPSDLAAITFTNKAAQEMASRVEELLGIYPLPAFVGTFHRFSLHLLRRWGDRVGLPQGFVICDQADQIRLVKKAMQTEEIDEKALSPRAVLSTISAAKNRLLTPEVYEREADDYYRRQVARVYRRYRDLMREAAGLDFDDMIMLAVRLLREDGELKERVRSRIRYLMVDEFQDTNHAQLQLVHELAGSSGNLTAVGDEDQAIYRWRGAELENILSFEDSFPGATVRRLERNYRSTANILDAAGEMVANNEKRRGKRLWTEDPPGAKLTLYRARDEHDEARWIVDAIIQDRDTTPLADCAILVRTHAQTRVLEEELLRRELPYTLVGGVRFYDRAEIKDILCYLRILRNPRDLLAFDRVLNQPPRGIGSVTRDRLDTLALERSTTVWDVLESDELPGLKPRATKAVRAFRDLIKRLRAEAETLPLPALLEAVFEHTEYHDLFDRSDPEGEARLENLEELLSAAQEFTEAEGFQGEEDVLGAFLDRVALQGDVDNADLEKGVSLMTLHSVKGLEFPTVIVAGLEDGTLPHFNSQASPEDIEEERRLLYVGMTRAEKRLLLTTAARRRVAGVYQDRDASHFLLEIPKRLLDEERSPSLFDTRPRTRASRPASSWSIGSRPSQEPTRGDGPRSFGSSGSRSTGSRAERPSASSSSMGPGLFPSSSPEGSGSASSASTADAVRSFFGGGAAQEEETSSTPSDLPTTDPLPERAAPPARPKPKPPQPQPRRRKTSPGELKRGMTVRHQSLGEGKILFTEGHGDDLRLAVYFPSHGRRKLVARYARLEIV